MALGRSFGGTGQGHINANVKCGRRYTKKSKSIICFDGERYPGWWVKIHFRPFGYDRKIFMKFFLHVCIVVTPSDPMRGISSDPRAMNRALW